VYLVDFSLSKKSRERRAEHRRCKGRLDSYLPRYRFQQQLAHIDRSAALDVSIADEVLRAQVVFLDSAFDYYLHEIVKLGIVEMYHGTWIVLPTEKFENLPLRMTQVVDAVAQNPHDDWLKKWIDKTYGEKPLMSYEAFKAVCNLIGLKPQDISQVFYQRGGSVKTIDQMEAAINDLYSHRNRIAHQSDRQSENAVRCAIAKGDVEKYIHNIRSIVDEMSKQIREKQSDKGELTSKE